MVDNRRQGRPGDIIHTASNPKLKAEKAFLHAMKNPKLEAGKAWETNLHDLNNQKPVALETCKQSKTRVGGLEMGLATMYYK